MRFAVFIERNSYVILKFLNNTFTKILRNLIEPIKNKWSKNNVS